jgi:hypothetical protein
VLALVALAGCGSDADSGLPERSAAGASSASEADTIGCPDPAEEEGLRGGILDLAAAQHWVSIETWDPQPVDSRFSHDIAETFTFLPVAAVNGETAAQGVVGVRRAMETPVRAALETESRVVLGSRFYEAEFGAPMYLPTSVHFALSAAGEFTPIGECAGAYDAVLDAVAEHGRIAPTASAVVATLIGDRTAAARLSELARRSEPFATSDE